jgi:hypothetical protein
VSDSDFQRVFSVSKKETLMIIKQIENDKTFILDSKRLKNYEELNKMIEIETW